jgi:hypothetical protein
MNDTIRTMKRRLLLSLCLLVAACQALSAPRSTSDAPASASKAVRGKHGLMKTGALGTHFDRDGDGRFEECRRGDTTYSDRNGDGVADFVVMGRDPESTFQWDSDGNGVLDSEMTLFMGYVPEWSARRVISVAGSRIFLDDNVGTLKAIPISVPRYVSTVKFVERALGRGLE